MGLSRLEENIYQLPLDEQLSLMARLAQNIRRLIAAEQHIELQLMAMADDPEIQHELELIETEFVSTETDGLETI